MKIELPNVIKFLLGEGELDGIWYGDHPHGKGAFWWRKELRTLFENQSQPIENTFPTDEEIMVELIARYTRGGRGLEIAKKGFLDAIEWLKLRSKKALESSPTEQPEAQKPVKKGMEKILVYRFQMETIAEALRLTSRINDSSEGKTCFDRQVRQSVQYAQNVLDGKIDELVPYMGGQYPEHQNQPQPEKELSYREVLHPADIKAFENQFIKNEEPQPEKAQEEQSELLECLEEAAAGLEWMLENKPEVMDKVDYEKLDRWNEVIKKYQIRKHHD